MMYEIKGVKMPKSIYQPLKATVDSEYQQGWRPSKSDIIKLVDSCLHPSAKLQNDMADLKKLLKRDE